LGSVFGGFLQKAAHDVTLLGRKRHLDAIKQHGLIITGIWGRHYISFGKVYTDATRIREQSFDLILISVKSYDTETAAKQAKKFLGPGTQVVSLQNGLGNVETIARLTGKGRTIGGRVIFGVELPKPGRVKVTVYAEEVMLGSPYPSVKKPSVETIVDLFNGAGIPTLYTDEITKYIWSKVLYNAALNPLSTILRQPYGYLLKRHETIEIMKQVVEEIFAVVKAAKITLFWKCPEEYLDILFTKLIPVTAEHHASMLQDITAGKKTEIDALNGAVVSFGKRYHVPTPCNEILTLLIKTMEKT